MNYFDAVHQLVGGEISGNDVGPLSEFTFHNGQTPPTEEAIQNKLAELEAAEPMRLLRQERNRRLVETDWRMVKDYKGTDQADWEVYRQALRDLPATAEPKLENGQLTNITWPEEPE